MSRTEKRGRIELTVKVDGHTQSFHLAEFDPDGIDFPHELRLLSDRVLGMMANTEMRRFQGAVAG